MQLNKYKHRIKNIFFSIYVNVRNNSFNGSNPKGMKQKNTLNRMSDLLKKQKSFKYQKVKNQFQKVAKDKAEIHYSPQQQQSKNKIIYESNATPISLTVNLPALEEFMHIDLKKSSSYERITRSKIQSNTKNPDSTKNHQNKEPKKAISIGRKSVYGIRQRTENIYSMDTWKCEVNRYISSKESCLEKHSDSREFPLMKLTRNNELLRQNMTRERSQSQKPEIVKALEKEELYTTDLIDRSRSPSIKRQINKNPKIDNIFSKPMLKERNQRQFPNSSFQCNKSYSKSMLLQQMMENSSTSERVLLNFVGNYFKNKFSPQNPSSHIKEPKKQPRPALDRTQGNSLVLPGSKRQKKKYGNHHYRSMTEGQMSPMNNFPKKKLSIPMKDKYFFAQNSMK